MPFPFHNFFCFKRRGETNEQKNTFLSSGRCHRSSHARFVLHRHQPRRREPRRGRCERPGRSRGYDHGVPHALHGRDVPLAQHAQPPRLHLQAPHAERLGLGRLRACAPAHVDRHRDPALAALPLRRARPHALRHRHGARVLNHPDHRDLQVRHARHREGEVERGEARRLKAHAVYRRRQGHRGPAGALASGRCSQLRRAETA